MNLYSYVITRDYGFAPNPFWNICTLATCKPQIREHALKGDWVAGFGSAHTEIAKKMVFIIMLMVNGCRKIHIIVMLMG